MKLKNKYLLYSCSGCSSAAQTANEIALRLNEYENVQMSCIAGIGGGVNSILKLSKMNSFKKILIDGCQFNCSRNCFLKENISYDLHIDLEKELKIKKKNSRYCEEDVLKGISYIENKISGMESESKTAKEDKQKMK